MSFTISKKRQQILDRVIEIESKTISRQEQEIKRRKKDLQELKNISFPINEKVIQEFTGYKIENNLLKDLYLTNNCELIHVDIETAHDSHNDFGYFYNEQGKCIDLFLGTNAGLYWHLQGSDKCRYADSEGKILKTPFEKASYKDFDVFGPFHRYDENDSIQGADISLDDWIVSIVAKGYFYLLKKTPTGERQYDA